MNLHDLVSNTVNGIKNNSPAILTGLSVVGTIAVGYFSGRAGYKVGYDTANENHLRREANELEVTPKELVQAQWKEFIPATFIGAATIACTIGAQGINSRRQAAIFSAFTISERALTEYRDRQIDTKPGQNRDEKIRTEAVTERIQDKDLSEIVVLNEQDCICYDVHSDRTFISNMEKIRKAENDIGRQCINDDNASLNDLYSKLGLKRIANGDDLGWNNEYPLEIKYTSVLQSGRPVLAIEFRIAPKLNYANVWR